MRWPSEADAPGVDFCGTCPSPLGDQPKFSDQLPDTGSGQGHNYNPLYPFGFGLSYTTFNYGGLGLPGAGINAGDPLDVAVNVTNTGKLAGDEVVQLYLQFPAVAGAPAPESEPAACFSR